MAAEQSSVASPLSGAITQALRGTGAEDSISVCDVLPGLTHVHFGFGAPVVRVHCQDGWTSLGAVVNSPVDPWTLLDRQSTRPNLKFTRVAQDVPRAGAYQLSAEIPADPVRTQGNDRSWFTSLLIGMRQLLHADPGAEPETVVDPAPTSSTESDMTSHITETLSDAGYSFELQDPSDQPAVRVIVPDRRQPRRVRITLDGQWWRVELSLGAGDVRLPGKPMCQAVGAFLLRASGAVRFARPCCQRQAGKRDPGAALGFEVHLPLQPTQAQLEHALGAAVTAVQRYEIEIESLATEAILSHAFLAIAGDPRKVVNKSTYEL